MVFQMEGFGDSNPNQITENYLPGSRFKSIPHDFVHRRYYFVELVRNV